MVLCSPDWTHIACSFLLLTVNLFRHPTLIEHGLYKLMFYLTIVNKILRHCHSWLAGQYDRIELKVRIEPGRIIRLRLTMLNLDISSFKNNVDPDQLTSKKPADQDSHSAFYSALHCILLTEILWIDLNNSRGGNIENCKGKESLALERETKSQGLF